MFLFFFRFLGFFGALFLNKREERARREIEVCGWGVFKIYLKSRSFCRSFRRIWRCIGRVWMGFVRFCALFGFFLYVFWCAFWGK
jgi:hypothetical protein